MNAHHTRVLIRLLPLLAALLISAKAMAADQELDRIVAVVGDDVVLQSELDVKMMEIVAQLRQESQPLPPREVLEQQVLEYLISQKLQLAAAERAGIKVDESTLTDAIARLAAQNGLTLEEFRQTLERGGVPFDEFREEMRKELLIGQLQAQQVVSRIVVTDQEVESFLANEARESPERSAYHLLHILVATPEGASPEDIEKAREKAEGLVEKLRGGADFRELALASSDGQQALKGGDLGWLEPGELPTLLVERVATMQRGEISEPLRSASGFHIVKVEDYKGGQDRHLVDQTKARHILIKTNEVVSDQDARTRLAQLRERILSGDDFAALARSHSDDKASAISGGDMGWVNRGDTVPEFERVMDRLQPGEISEPFQTPFGWHIVQVLDRRQYDSTAEARIAAAREAIRNRKASEAIELYVRSLRDQAYVDIRLDGR
ncbi:MAG: peptidylprolyl isomerase [Chromatiales bacterium]|jgi:peptidyl-prolyl cis-trans isomerase SurA